jgi:hypothetical protein
MNITLDSQSIEVNSNKLDTIFEQQKSTINDVISVYQSEKDVQGLFYFIISWNSITNSIMEAMLEKHGADKIIEILKRENVECHST